MNTQLQIQTNPNKIARIAAVLYLLLVPLGILGILYVPSTLFVPGDVLTTTENILANETLFRVGIVSALVAQLVNMVLVLYLYKLLKPVNRTIAWLMVLFLLLGMPIAMLNEVNNTAVLIILHSPEPAYALVELFLEMHEYGIHIASIFWGLWLFPMGYLAFKSNYIPKLIGVMLMIGCFGYLADSFIYLLLPNLGIEFAQYTFIGEIALPLWLLFRGVNVAQWQKQAISLQSA